MSNSSEAVWSYTQNKYACNNENLCKKIYGSGALPGKFLLTRIKENNKYNACLGEVRFSRGELCPAGLEMELG